MHDVSALVVSFISRLLFSLSSSFCPYRAESRVCILRGVSYCKCRLPVMLWGPWPVWTLGHKKIIVSDPDIYDQPGQVPPWWCGAPSSSDVTLATSFYHQPVFMFMGNSQILPQITVWRPINFCSNIWVGWKLPPSHIWIIKHGPLHSLVRKIYSFTTTIPRAQHVKYILN